jgi:hypothetical protein
MVSDEPIKALMTHTLNLMFEAEFDVKIGAQKSEQKLIIGWGRAPDKINSP